MSHGRRWRNIPEERRWDELDATGLLAQLEGETQACENFKALLAARDEELAGLRELRTKEHVIYRSMREELAGLRAALERAARELGVPTDGYPAPVANAWRIIMHALAPSTAGPE